MIQRWHILGAGAMGRLLACKLQQAGINTCLITRTGPATRFNQTLDDLSELRHIPLYRAGIATLKKSEIGGLWVTTKANDALGAVKGVAHLLSQDAPVILMHNGMGVLEQLADHAPALRPFSAITTEGAYLEKAEPGAEPRLVHAGRGRTRVGRGHDAPPIWFAPFSDSSIGMSWETDIDQALWEKLLINAAINPLTALNHCPNGALATDPALWDQVIGLCGELAAVSSARGYAYDANDLVAKTREVIVVTAANQSSMLRDVLEGRPTELESITGFLLREAQRLQVPCPRNTALYRRLDGLHLSH